MIRLGDGWGNGGIRELSYAFYQWITGVWLTRHVGLLVWYFSRTLLSCFGKVVKVQVRYQHNRLLDVLKDDHEMVYRGGGLENNLHNDRVTSFSTNLTTNDPFVL